MLHLASGHKQLEVVQYLVESAADVNAVNAKGKTPLESAQLHPIEFPLSTRSMPLPAKQC